MVSICREPDSFRKVVAMAEVNEETKDPSKEPISSDMIVRDIILAHPDAAEVLMRIGMGCISCPAALMESIGDACMVHGLDGEEVVKYLNQELNLPQSGSANA